MKPPSPQMIQVLLHDRKRVIWVGVVVGGLALVFILVSLLHHQAQSYQGQLEARSVKVSSQVPGVLVDFRVEEGDHLKQGQLIARVDTAKLLARHDEVHAQMKSVSWLIEAAQAQLRQATIQARTMQQVYQRNEQLFKKRMISSQNFEEVSAQRDVQVSRVSEMAGRLKSLLSQKEQLMSGVRQSDLQVEDATITSPLTGIVISKFFERGEMVMVGTPIVEMADLSVMTARVYVPLSKLPAVHPGQPVRVRVDGERRAYGGKVSWIASEAEFTPKSIMTRDTRTTLVYAVKIEVANPDMRLKIGMPVEVLMDERWREPKPLPTQRHTKRFAGQGVLSALVEANP